MAGGVGRTDSPQVRVGGDSALERTEAYRKANPNASADELQSIYASASQQPDLLSTNPLEGGLSIKAGAADSVKNKTDNLNTANAINKTSLGGVDQAISGITADAVNDYYATKDSTLDGSGRSALYFEKSFARDLIHASFSKEAP